MKNTILKTRLSTCHNLMANPDTPGAFSPVAKPVKIAGEGLQPLLNIDKSNVLASATGAPALLTLLDTSTGLGVRLADTNARCAAAASGRRIVAMTDDRPIIIDPTLSGNYTEATAGSDTWPPVAIIATPGAPLTMNIPEIILRRQYVPGDEVAESDRKLIIGMLNRAYAYVVGEAAAQGVAFQPVMARVVVKDASGAVVQRGPLRLVMPPEGLPFDDPLRLQFDSSMSTQSFSISVPTYRLQVVAEASPSRLTADRGRYLELEVSPMFHTWSPDIESSGCVFAVNRGGASGAPGISVTMPGATSALTSHDEAHNVRLLQNVVARFDSLAKSVPVATNPFERGCSVVLKHPSVDTLAAQVARLRSVAAADIAAADPDRRTLASMNAPHGFTSKRIASTTKALIFGNIDILPYEGYTAADYAASASDVDSAPTASDQWLSTTVVTYADGSTSRRVETLRRCVPTSLAAMIEYPDATAVALEITVAKAGASTGRRWSVALRPDATGLHALSVSDGLADRLPDTVAFSEPLAATSSSRRRPSLPRSGLVAVAPAHAPLEVSAVNDIGAPVTAVTVAASTAAAWDYGRTRFNVFTAQHIELANVSADLLTIESGTIARVGVADQNAVAVTATAAVYFLTPGGDLKSISGSRVSDLSCPGLRSDVLGYDPVSNRLVATSSTGTMPLQYIDPRKDGRESTADSVGPTNLLFATHGGLLAATQDGLMDVARRPAPPDVDVYVQLICASPRTYPALGNVLRRVVWNIDATHFDGTMSVSRLAHGGRSAEATTYCVQGRVAAPIVMPVVARPLFGSLFEVCGEVSADASVALPIVEFC